MTPDDIQKAVDGHQQKYLDSCPASLAEIMLKAQGLVDSGYYVEQDRDQNAPVGLSNIADKEFFGWRFRVLPKERLTFLQSVDDLLSQGKAVGIFLQIDPAQKYHGYIVKERRGSNYTLLSKMSPQPPLTGQENVAVTIPFPILANLHGNDCIYLEEVRKNIGN